MRQKQLSSGWQYKKKKVDFFAIKKQRRRSWEYVPSPAILRVVKYLCLPFSKCSGEDLECWHDPLGNS